MPDTQPVLYGKYQLLSQLARGGMAEVFKAKAHGVEGFEKVLVIKRILPELSENPRFVEMFINEAKIAVSLSHANIVQVFDLGYQDKTYYIAMEYVAGMDLAAMLKRARKLKRGMPIPLCVFVISELTKGLDYAHRRRDTDLQPLHIIHRDVSPQNVLLSYEGEVKLTDFGIAKARKMAQAVTELGVVKGKYAYMSPEQLSGGALDSRTDIFSAGTLLYETITGQNPFQTGSTYDTLQRIREGAHVPLQEVAPDVPDEVAQIVARAMAPRVEDRYATAGELYEDLIQYLYSTGKRVGARDLGDHLGSLRGTREDGSQRLHALEVAFEVTAFDEPLPERTRVSRGRKPTREVRAPLAPPHRERTEWRDVTALSLCMAHDDELKAETIAYVVERFGGTLIDDLELPAPAGKRFRCVLFGDLNPDGRDTHNAAHCALKLSRAASAAAADAGKSTTLAIALGSGRVLFDLSDNLLRSDDYHALFDSCGELAKQTGEGQILVDSEAEKALRSRFRLVPSDAHEGAHLLVSERSMADAYGRFIGRRRELRQMGEALAVANRGELQIIGVSGEAGSGKSRLLLETMRRLGMAGINAGLHVVSLTPQLRQVPLSAIQEMLRVVLGVDEFDPAALLRDRTTRLRELGLLSVEQAAVASVLGLPSESGRNRGHRPLRAALLRIIRKLAEDRLTIFAFDGAEYTDSDSLAIIDDMLKMEITAKVAVVLCSRPGYESQWRDMHNYSAVPLRAMSDEDVARLTATRLGADEIPFDLLREVTTKSAGNPLYVEEYLRALQESGSVHFVEGQVRFDPRTSALDMPKTLRGIVASRVGKLGPTQRYVLQVASLVGERFRADIVAAAAQESIETVTEALVVREMEGSVSAQGRGEYMFSHGLVRQVLMEGITLQARREIHAALAESIVSLYPERVDEMAERLAHHHHEAGHHEQAVHYLVRAADRLEGEGAIESAIHELKRAIDLLSVSNGSDRVHMLEHYERLAELCFRNRNLAEGAELMDRAIKAAEAIRSHRHVARFCMWRGRLLVSSSRIEEGRRWLDQAHHVARGLTDWELSCDVFLATADADARSGEFERSVGFLREALQLSTDAADRPSQLRCLLPLCLTYARMGDNEAATASLRDIKQQAEQTADPLLMSQVYRLESQVHYHARNQEASAAAAGRAMEIAREAGLNYEAALNAHNMGEAFLRLGDHRRAFAALRSSYEVATEHGFTRLQMSNMRALGFIDATRFGSNEGRTRVIQAIEYARRHDFVWDVIQGEFFLAMIEQARGDVDAARAKLREVLSLAAGHGHRNYIEDAEAALLQLESSQPIELPT